MKALLKEFVEQAENDGEDGFIYAFFTIIPVMANFFIAAILKLATWLWMIDAPSYFSLYRWSLTVIFSVMLILLLQTRVAMYFNTPEKMAIKEEKEQEKERQKALKIAQKNSFNRTDIIDVDEI